MTDIQRAWLKVLFDKESTRLRSLRNQAKLQETAQRVYRGAKSKYRGRR